MKRISRIFTAVCIALICAVQTAFSAVAAYESSEYSARAVECFDYFTEQRGVEDFWDGLEFGYADWAAYCRARLYGAEGSEQYASSIEAKITELSKSDGFVRPTEYQRAAICLAVLGRDTKTAAELAVFYNDMLDRQGFNAYLWALIVLNVTGEQPPENAVNTAETLTEHIILNQHADGSFALFGDTGDVDITAAAVYALAGADNPEAEQAAQRGADWLCGIDGGYSTMGIRNCESTAQAVIALCATGRTEKAREAAEMLEEYRREGGYAHLPDGDINGLATMQVLEALTALELAEQGKSLFEPAMVNEIPQTQAVETEQLTAEQLSEEQSGTAEVIPEEQGEFSGKHIKALISAAFGLAAVFCAVLFIIKRKKALAVTAAVLAVLSGCVWLLDIKTPEEYYSQSMTGSMRAVVSADCLTVLDNMASIDPVVNPADVIPEDGIVIEKCEVMLPEGASAFDALTAAAREQRVRVDYVGSGWGTYVRGIGYIYEFGFGELSGWMYRVNGEFPDVSASDFTLKEGDIVEFVYTCDLGRDVGDVYSVETDGVQ